MRRVVAGDVVTWRGASWIVRAVHPSSLELVKPGDPQRTAFADPAKVTDVGPWR